jgi:outer membrane lipoprotein-sorting protein
MSACSSPQAAAPAPQRIAQAPPTPASTRIENDPAAFLEQVLARTEKLDEYELTFYRQERTGTFVKKLGEMERIRAWFRKQPFSVRFEWPDPGADYDQSLYIQGRNDNKLIVRERKGLLGMPPQTRVLNVMDPVTFGRSKNPITDFGIEQLTRRTVDALRDPALRNAMTIRYQGVVNLDPVQRPAYHLRIERPAGGDIRYARQDFYIDTETLLPAGTDLYLPDGKLDARYRYTDINTNVRLTDADFTMDRRAG